MISSPPVNEKIVTVDESPVTTKRDWRVFLQLKKSPRTQDSYQVHILKFISKCGENGYYTQQDIDSYYVDLEKDDKAKPKEERESTAVKQMRKVALKFYLNECLGLNLNFKSYSCKGVINKRPHKAYTDDEMKNISEIVKGNMEMNAIVNLLYNLAGRIQDVVGIPFGHITKAKKKGDTREVYLDAKKSTARNVVIPEATVQAVEEYRKAVGKDDADIMFEPGAANNPANKWVKRVKQYFKREHGMDVQTHNFRKTAVTEFFNVSKDIVATSKYIGHSNVKTTSHYVEKTPQEITDKTNEMLAARKERQTKLPASHQINQETGTRIEHKPPPTFTQTPLGDMGTPTAHRKVVAEPRKRPANLR